MAGDTEPTKVAEPVPDEAAPEPILAARGLTKHFPVRRRGARDLGGPRRVVHAVDDVTVELFRGRITAVVGESGSGKSTIARLLARLEPATAGTLTLAGEDVPLRRHQVARSYLTRVQMIFQDPFASLNPIHTVEHHLVRPLKLHGPSRTRAQTQAEVLRLLERVSLTPPSSSPASARTNSPADSANACRSPGRSRSSRRCCSRTNRCRCWTCRSDSAC